MDSTVKLDALVYVEIDEPGRRRGHIVPRESVIEHISKNSGENPVRVYCKNQDTGSKIHHGMNRAGASRPVNCSISPQKVDMEIRLLALKSTALLAHRHTDYETALASQERNVAQFLKSSKAY